MFFLAMSLQADTYSKALKFYENKNYRKCSTLLLKALNGKDAQTYYAQYTLLIKCSLQAGMVAPTVNLITKNIKALYGKVHTDVVKSFKKSGFDELEDIPDGLGGHYYLLANIFYSAFLMTNETNEDFANKAKLYTDLASESEFKYGSPEKLLSKITFKLEERKRKVYRFEHYVALDYLSWTEDMKLIGPTGSNTNFTSTFFGIHAGLGLGYINYYHQFYGQVGVFTGSVGANTDTGTLPEYKQDSSGMGAQLVLGYLYRIGQSDSGIGLAFPIMYRKSDYTIPQNYSIDHLDRIDYGVMMEINWNLGHIILNSKYGIASQVKSALWGLGLKYKF